MYSRVMKLVDSEEGSVFLWGARQTGKSTLLRTLFPDAHFYDLLKSDLYKQLSQRPALLREELELTAKDSDLVIIDEVQKIPELLDEVHWLIENKHLRFILCGSSARKLKRCGANLLGGRAIRNVLFPLVSAEIPDFDLIKAVNNGMLPPFYPLANPQKRLQSYVGDYLKEEIYAEALTRNLNNFSRFLEIAALNDGEMINYQNIASDCGVSAPTVKEYFNILYDTLLAYSIPAYTKAKKRRLIQTPKCYLFDIGVVNCLTGRKSLRPGSIDFGHALEHLIVQEIIAYLEYYGCEQKLSYWRTTSGYEVDAVLGDAETAIEIKSCEEVQSRHLHGLKAFKEEHPEARLIIVSLDARPRLFNGVEVWPAQRFLQQLWAGKIAK